MHISCETAQTERSGEGSCSLPYFPASGQAGFFYFYRFSFQLNFMTRRPAGPETKG